MSQASSLASIEEDALFFKSNDKLEAYPTIKTRAPKPGWFMVFCFRILELVSRESLTL